MFTLLAVPYSISAAWAGCGADAITTTIQDAEQAFLAEDPKRMDGVLSGLRRSLACTHEPVSPSLCADVHRTYALRAWLAADKPGAVGSFRAMLHADPRAALPPEIVPRNHALQGLLMQAEEAPNQWTRAPVGGWVLVDGLRTGAVPVGQPYLLQPIKGDGKAGGAKLVRSGSDGPSRALSAPKRAFQWTGVGLGVVSVGLYGGAWASNRAYHRAVTDEDNVRIGSLHAATNALSVSSLTAVGLGAGVFTFSALYFD